ncbi:venom phosphodiesterase 2-like isoform X2 [Oratosquilla oratoria]|uniref:venom phosphodiesterase 2-like isoform X2 n=1 Tax=Oratosquilla oratoria TaxID=337810 RepID=UPI003F766008
MSSLNLEELEMKEATPSISPSQNENVQYTRKWRVVLALLLGATLIGVCMLGFYISVEARSGAREAAAMQAESQSKRPLPSKERWRLDQTCLLTSNNRSCPAGFENLPLLLIGIDGLRPDFLTPTKAPALYHLASCGVQAKHMTPVYPTYTFPNLYSIVTGLYPESHGIVSNRMYDPHLNTTFEVSSHESFKSEWWGGEPIWNTATKQGKRSATYFWVGSDVRIQDRYPTYWQKYSQSVSFDERIREVLDLLTLPPAERPSFITVYFHEPDATEHKFGVHSQEAEGALLVVDGMIDLLMSSLHRLNLTQCVNIMMVSDHGVARSTCSSSIRLEEYVPDIEKRARVTPGAVGRMQVLLDTEEEKDDLLSKLRCARYEMRALPKNLIPKRYHYTNNDRIEEIILDTQPGFRVVTDSSNYCILGEHGFNNIERTMQASFVAHGPAFNVGQKTDGFLNIELYNLMCYILNLDPAPNNGTEGSLHHILRVPPTVRQPEELFLKEEVLGMPQKEDPPPPVVEEEPPKENTTAEVTATTEEETAPKAEVTEEGVEPTPDEAVIEVNATSEAEVVSTVEEVTTVNDTAQEAPQATATPTPSAEATPEETPKTKVDVEEQPKEEEVVQEEPPQEEVVEECRCDTLRRYRADKATRQTSTPAQLTGIHAPFGFPGYAPTDLTKATVKVLPHTNYVIGVTEVQPLAVWSSFTISNASLQGTPAQGPNLPAALANIDPQDLKKEDPVPPCWMADSRLERTLSDQCDRSINNGLYADFNITLRQFFPEELERPQVLEEEGYLLTNMAPVLPGFENGPRAVLTKSLQTWVDLRGEVNVIHGPVFDLDLDGHQDNVTFVLNNVKPLVPTDYFYVITSCKNGSLTTCPGSEIDLMSFVFPNTRLDDNCCMLDTQYLLYHMTTVRDIELLTGLRFFRNLFFQDSARLRSRLPLEIWSTKPSSDQRSGKGVETHGSQTNPA